jgi:hypothetical protein
MVVTVDKFTAVKMFDKVQRLWKEDIKALLGLANSTKNDVEKMRLKKTLEWMRQVQMAVVISEEAGEQEKFAARGLPLSDSWLGGGLQTEPKPHPPQAQVSVGSASRRQLSNALAAAHRACLFGQSYRSIPPDLRYCTPVHQNDTHAANVAIALAQSGLR